MSDTRFDQDLRTVLRDMAPADAPDTLRHAVGEVSGVAPAKRREPAGFRTFIAVTGIAAALLIVVGGIFVLAWGRPIGPGPAAGPTQSPAPTAGAYTTIGYKLLPLAGKEPPAAAITTVSDIMQARLQAIGIVGSYYFASGGDPDITVTVPTDELDRVRRVLGATGHLDFVPLGQTGMTDGQTVDLTKYPPLFSGDQVASAAIGANQTGQRTVGFTLTGTGRDLFAAYTETHVGDFFAIVLDGKVVSAPVIQASIPNGQVEISQSSGIDLQAAQDLVALLASRDLPYPRELPYPVQEVSAAATSAPPAGLPTPDFSSDPTPAATGSPSPTAGPWTGLDVSALAGAPTGIEAVIPWTGGYLAIAHPDAAQTTGAWISTDGRAWSALPANTLGLDDPSGNTVFLGGAACGGGVLVLTGGGPTEILWASSDGRTWTSGPFGGTGIGQLAGGDGGAITPAETGAAVEATTDCVNWRTIRLPGPASTTLTGVAAFGGGFVAVGYSGTSGTAVVEPLAWRSTDGVTWSAATVPSSRGEGFASVAAGSEGFVATSTQPGYTPGVESLWTSPGGRAWTRVDGGPLGVIASGEGVGSIAGTYLGDGIRLLAFGTQGGGSGPTEYWAGAGVSWWNLVLTGSGAAGLAADGQAQPFLLRDGILFSGTGSTWLGTVAGR